MTVMSDDGQRIVPALPPAAFQTFQIARPLTTHWRPATCAEVGCEQYVNGWAVRVEGLPPEMLHDVRTSGRRYRTHEVAAGETWLVFEAGQPCFRAEQHQAPLERPELYVVRGGDWRGNPTGQEPYCHRNAEDWVDQFATNQDRVARAIQEG